MARQPTLLRRSPSNLLRFRQRQSMRVFAWHVSPATQFRTLSGTFLQLWRVGYGRAMRPFACRRNLCNKKRSNRERRGTMTTDRTKPNSHDWTEPGVFEVAPGVHRIPLPLPNDGLRSVNVYAIMEMDGLVLIDSGWALPEAREALESALGTLGCGLGDVRRIFITHVHRDHYSQAVALRRAFGIPISIGVHEERSLNVLTSPWHGRLTAQLALL